VGDLDAAETAGGYGLQLSIELIMKLVERLADDTPEMVSLSS